jgi:Golgi nucleoside diphosphatase
MPNEVRLYAFLCPAGMRLLLEERMNLVFKHIDTQMQNGSFNPFQYRTIHHTRILSGEEEGVFAWIAVNYLTGALKSNGMPYFTSSNHFELSRNLKTFVQVDRPVVAYL